MKEEEETFEVTERAFSQSVTQFVLHSRNKPLFHPWGIPLVLALVWLMVVIVQFQAAFKSKQTLTLPF